MISFAHLTHYLGGVMGLLSGMPTCGLTNGVITEKSDFLHGSGFQERAFQETGSGYCQT